MSKKLSNNATEFHVDTRFQKLARRPGGVSREDAIAQAQDKIEDIRPDLDAWLDSELQSLNDLVTAAINSPSSNKWIVDASDHARHLRNVGSTIGFELLTYVADILFNMFQAAANGEEINIEAVKCYVDSLHLARRNEYRHVRPEQVPELTEGLRRVAAKQSSPVTSK
jgi:hypothetical protein